MKNLISKLSMLLVAMALMFVACEKPQSEEPTPEVKDPVLTLTSEATMEFAADKAMGTITYSMENAAEGVELTVTTDAEWITSIITSSRNKVLFTVEANDGEAREAKIAVAYGDLGFEVTVKQAECAVKEPVLTLTSESTMEFAVEGGFGQISYTLENPVEGVELTATTEAEWISGLVASGGDKVLFTVEANDGEAREAKIAVAYGDLGFEVTVKQAERPRREPVLTLLSEEVMEFSEEGGNGEISYDLENAVEGVELTATTEAEWISGLVASGGDKVLFTVAANDGEAREAKIAVAYGDLGFEVTVKQAAKEQGEVSTENLTFELCTVEGFPSVSMYSYGDIRLVDSNGKNYVQIEVNDGSLYTHQYTIDNLVHYDSGTLYYENTFVIYDGNPANASAEKVQMKSGTVDVTVDGDNCTIVIDAVLADDNKFSGTYTGTKPF